MLKEHNIQMTPDDILMNQRLAQSQSEKLPSAVDGNKHRDSPLDKE